MTIKDASTNPILDSANVGSALAKVPAVTIAFWIIKILATTLGETAGDAVSMSWLGETTAAANGWGYLIGTAIFLTILVVLVVIQIAARKFHPLLYWSTIIASTTAGTTMADFATRSMGIGYAGGSTLLLILVLLSLLAWRFWLGSVSVQTVHEPRAELFYWITITFSQTLGTALGDWTAETTPFRWIRPICASVGINLGDGFADDDELGFLLAAILFAALLIFVAILYYSTRINRDLLFWAAFILTRPLGAAVGDWLDKPLARGGLNFSRPIASLVLGVVILAMVLLIPQRAEQKRIQST